MHQNNTGVYVFFETLHATLDSHLMLGPQLLIFVPISVWRYDISMKLFASEDHSSLGNKTNNKIARSSTKKEVLMSSKHHLNKTPKVNSATFDLI